MTTTTHPAAEAASLWPARIRVLTLPGGRHLLLDRRALTVCVMLALLILAVGGLALTLGESPISVSEVFAALTGHADRGTTRIVVEWRLPRVAIAVLGGAALAMSGAIFQSMTRNPLGSPDIIGFNTGAYTGALLSTVLAAGATSAGAAGATGATGAAGSGGAFSVTAGALVGGLVTALVVYGLAFKGGLQGFRLIVVGIGVSAMLMAFNSYLLVTTRLEAAVSVSIWGAGSLNGVRWPDVLPVVRSLVVLVPLTVLMLRHLTCLELGDDLGRLLGLRPELTRIGMLVTGVGLIAVVTAIVGPITFVALAAPQIAKRLVRASGPQLLASALVGGLLLLLSDVIAQRIIAPGQLPVGVVTACLGGAYLVWLLSRGPAGTRGAKGSA